MFTSDAGWGCMLRTAQMMLGECLQRHLKSKEDKRHILKLFIDAPKHYSMFSIHNICMHGKKYGMNVGEWYGPTTASIVLRDLVNGNGENLGNLVSYSTDDNVIYLDEILSLTMNFSKSLLIFCPIRLGLNKVNEKYVSPLIKLLQHPQCVGFVGGKPMKSLYFVGSFEDQLLYLDPHFVQPTVDTSAVSELLSEDELKTYTTRKIRTMPIKDLDPSLSFGFYINTKQQLMELKNLLNHLTLQNTALIGFSDTRQGYVCEESFNEDDFVVL